MPIYSTSSLLFPMVNHFSYFSDFSRSISFLQKYVAMCGRYPLVWAKGSFCKQSLVGNYLCASWSLVSLTAGYNKLPGGVLIHLGEGASLGCMSRHEVARLKGTCLCHFGSFCQIPLMWDIRSWLKPPGMGKDSFPQPTKHVYWHLGFYP